MTAVDAIYLAVTVCAISLAVYKLRHRSRPWGTPSLWALCAFILCYAATAWIIAPATHAWVDRVTATPNLAALLSFVVVTAGTGSATTLALYWGYPADAVRTRVRTVFLFCGSAIVAMTVLFTLSSVPDERPVDFVTYYATEPTVAATVLIWLLSAGGGWAVITGWCFSWARRPDFAALPWLRLGLRLYGLSGAVYAVFTLFRIVVVCANWFGVTTMNGLDTASPVVAALAVNFILAAALLLPAWGPRWPLLRTWLSRWRAWWILRPLHQALADIDPGAVLVARKSRLDSNHRVRRMVMELGDWRWLLAPLFDPLVADMAEAAADGATGERLRAVREAAQLKAAAEAWRRGVRAAAPSTSDGDIRDGTDIQAELSWWLQVARAYDRRSDR
ncbi:MAB_1171c family putative transporter [Kutzneria chonburiensis]|uniref:MAB_1171c family putative transporter n=1 Tax=Kutzneria chonburiensis TaxID=1483604 RepID=A0ABV6MX16_9PSEU|nr:MAB_1171c family putative transporter [Kutzneria chonburiensis]